MSKTPAETMRRAAALSLEDVVAADGCEATMNWLGFDWACGQPSAGRFRRICVHEHVREGRLCQEHVDLAPMGLCRTCFDLGGDLAHECLISLVPVTSEAAS